MRVGKSYLTLGPSSAMALRGGGPAHPIPLSKWGPRAQKGTGLDPDSLLSPKCSPTQTPILREAGRAQRWTVQGSGTGVGSGVSAGPPKANAEGIRVPGNQSCRASGRGLGARRRTRGQGPGRGDERRPRAPASGGGRAGNKWLRGCGRDPAAPTFQPRGGRTAR